MVEIKENFFVDEPEQETSVRDAWRCDGCSRLVYNLTPPDARGFTYPAHGAPVPKYLNSEYRQVCNVCYDMFQPLRKNTSYWEISGTKKGFKPLSRGDSSFI